MFIYIYMNICTTKASSFDRTLVIESGIHVCIFMYIYVYIYVCMCMFAHTCVYTHIYIYIYIALRLNRTLVIESGGL
jgi:hypothetical protein